MKNANYLVSALLVFSVLCGGASAQQSGDIDSLLKEFGVRGSHHVVTMPVDISIQPVQMPGVPGPVSLKLTVSPNFCKELTSVKITKIDRLEYNGEVEWTFPCVPKDTFELELNVTIPANDTSGLEFEVICDEWSMPFYAYFHTTDGRVKFYQFNHRIPFPSSKHKAPKKTIDMSDPPMTEQLRHGKISVGYEDEEGNWIPVDSINKNALKPTVKGAHYKPIINYLENFSKKLHWILPVVRNRKKLYDTEDKITNEYEDVINLTLAQTR
ncbi:MAG: hypothetical protein IIA17_10175, partial [candidate division Zixibacteria bacterium]|nr:hypothetical protein [candidate division Zixibacteria bacterium]